MSSTGILATLGDAQPRTLNFWGNDRGTVALAGTARTVVDRDTTSLQEQGGGDYPRQQLTTYHTSTGVPGKNGVRKFPLAPFYPPPLLFARDRDHTVTYLH